MLKAFLTHSFSNDTFPSKQNHHLPLWCLRWPDAAHEYHLCPTPWWADQQTATNTPKNTDTTTTTFEYIGSHPQQQIKTEEANYSTTHYRRTPRLRHACVYPERPATGKCGRNSNRRSVCSRQLASSNRGASIDALPPDHSLDYRSSGDRVRGVE